MRKVTVFGVATPAAYQFATRDVKTGTAPGIHDQRVLPLQEYSNVLLLQGDEPIFSVQVISFDILFQHQVRSWHHIANMKLLATANLLPNKFLSRLKFVILSTQL